MHFIYVRANGILWKYDLLYTEHDPQRRIPRHEMSQVTANLYPLLLLLMHTAVLSCYPAKGESFHISAGIDFWTYADWGSFAV